MKGQGRGVVRNIRIGIFSLILMLLLLMLASCSKTIYVPVESKRTEYIDRIKTDSIHITDSVHIREKGDTVWLTRWRTEYRDRLKVDSILIRDSISVPYPIEIALTRWQQTKMDMGGLAIGGLGVIVLAFLVWLIIKFKR